MLLKKAVIFGAGQIGRGFLGQVLFHSGYKLIFIDVSQKTVDLLNRYKEYQTIAVGAEEKSYAMTGLKAYLPTEPEAAEEIAEATLVVTAIGPGHLDGAAGVIAKGIALRCDRKIEDPLAVIACENMEFGTSKLYEFIKPLLTDEQLAYCSSHVGFPDAEVSRMVMPLENCDNPLTVMVEQYMEWVVDKTKLKGDLGSIEGMELTDNPTAYIRRKIYTLTGHAMFGYMGYGKKYEYIYQAVYDPEIFATVFRALSECGRAWSLEFGEPQEGFDRYITIMLRRFADTRMKDPCVRICRDPIRKLSKDERLIEPALIALKHDILPSGILAGIKSALKYDYSGDEQAVELQRRIREGGLARTLANVSGLSEDSLLSILILRAYNGISDKEAIVK